MSTLHDELLQDFEASGDEAGDDQLESGYVDEEALYAAKNGAPASGDTGDMDGLDDSDSAKEDDFDHEMRDADDPKLEADDDDAESNKAKIEKMQLGKVSDVRLVASLFKALEPVLEKIAHYKTQPAETSYLGNLEDHPEYRLLTQSNSLSTQIDSEIVLVHKYIRDHYSVRFPELETLITNPLEYAKVVAILGNGPMDAESIKAISRSINNPLKAPLASVLDGPSLMIVTVEATTSKGQEMAPDALARVIDACLMAIHLDSAKKTLTEYVQSRMSLFAPNLSALIGSLTAAQLLNAAGGLNGLAKSQPRNLPSWGSKKHRSTALASNVGIRQQGFLFRSPIIRGVPNDVKIQALRIVSNKVVIAARTDSSHYSRDGSAGAELRQYCLDRLDKLQEEPLSKGARALPVPDDKPSRKRGGRRARKAKEATAMTDLRKAQNRMAFGKEEREVGYGVGDSTAGLGMIGQANDGRVRALQIDQRTRAKLSAKSKGWGGATSLNSSGGSGGAASSLKGFGAGTAAGSMNLQGKGLRTSGVGTNVGGGIVSSLNLSSMQGLELVDPKVQAELSRKRKADEDRWFKGGAFTQIGGLAGATTAVNGASGAGSGMFKKPLLPPAKRLNTGATKGGHDHS